MIPRISGTTEALGIPLQVSTPSALFSLGPQAFVSTFSDFVSGVLEVNNTNVDVSDYVLAPGETVTSADAPVKMDVQFSVDPAATGSPQHVSPPPLNTHTPLWLSRYLPSKPCCLPLASFQPTYSSRRVLKCCVKFCTSSTNGLTSSLYALITAPCLF